MSELTELDPVIHAVARLRITSTLAALGEGDSLTFSRLRDVLGLTPGNLTTHLAKLDEARYVSIVKHGAGRTATTTVALTTRGRRAYADYTTALRTILASG